MATPIYVPIHIDPIAGLVVPSYASILSMRISQYQAIYGVNVYLGTDSAKYQELSIEALCMYDTNLGSQLAYNSRSPLTAVGAGLDSVVKLNGLTRLVPSYSTAPVTITGVAGTVITNGGATDNQGYLWMLPLTVTIPNSGSVLVSAQCTTSGAIQAAPGAIATISAGQTAGWTAVNNPSAALPGVPTEQDSQLRSRQGVSVAGPSITLIGSTLAAIAAVPGVTRYALGIPSADGMSTSIENPTAVTDEFGNPAHSISMVVEGGSPLDVATAIFNKSGIGVLRNAGSSSGSQSISVVNPVSGIAINIGFQTPTYVPIYVTMVIHGLTGYTSTVPTQIQSAIVAYLNTLQIGETVTFSSFYSVAQSVMPNLALPQFSVTSLFIGTSPSPTGTANLAMLYYQVAQGISANIIISEA